MKKIILLLTISLLLLPIAIAATNDMSLFVDGNPLSADLEVVPGTTYKLEVQKTNVLFIQDFQVSSDNKIVQQLLEQKLGNKRNYNNDIYLITIPEEAPGGSFDVQFTVDYYDLNYAHKRYTKSFTMNSEGSSSMGIISNLISETTAAEIVNEYTQPTLERLDPELQYIELNAQDLKALGISREDYVKCLQLLNENKKTEADKCLPKIEKVDSQRLTKVYNEQDIDRKFKPKGDFNPDVLVTKNTYKVSKNNNAIDKSKLTYSVTAPAELSNMELVIEIPKEIAQNVNELDFSDGPEVLEEDPVIKWAFKNIPQGQTKDYTMTASKDVQNFDTLAAAAADEPSWISKLIRWVVRKFQ